MWREAIESVIIGVLIGAMLLPVIIGIPLLF